MTFGSSSDSTQLRSLYRLIFFAEINRTTEAWWKKLKSDSEAAIFQIGISHHATLADLYGLILFNVLPICFRTIDSS